ncbi:MAG: cytochrome c peroxidase, partial [Gammaproteobacteria bacterium]
MMSKSYYASVALVFIAFATTPVSAQFLEAPADPPPSAKDLALPVVEDIQPVLVDPENGTPIPLVDNASGDGANGYIKDLAAAELLGKAFFWDLQAGSKKEACGSCHYHAGVDNRFQNQLSPGLNAAFDATATGGGENPNEILTEDDFPFHQLFDPSDRDSTVLFDTDDIASSAGTYHADFVDIVAGSSMDDCNVGCHPDPDGFIINGINTRRVEPRNTPTMINAAFNHRNFWDGRANNIFNGVDGFGKRNSNARVLEVQGGGVVQIEIALQNASLASQAVTPPTSDKEMSCVNRPFSKIGKKLIAEMPLRLQQVHWNDSVLGGLSRWPNNGLDTNYTALIQAAISDRFWDSNALFDVAGNEIGSGVPANSNQYTLIEANFPLIWGLAIMAYERTLVSDDAPYDQWAEAPGGREPTEANTKGILTASQMRGMNLFFTNELQVGEPPAGILGKRANCSTCHQGPHFTTVSFPFTEEEESGEFPEQEVIIERMRRGDGVT